MSDAILPSLTLASLCLPQPGPAPVSSFSFLQQENPSPFGEIFQKHLPVQSDGPSDESVLDTSSQEIAGQAFGEYGEQGEIPNPLPFLPVGESSPVGHVSTFHQSETPLSNPLDKSLLTGKKVEDPHIPNDHTAYPLKDFEVDLNVMQLMNYLKSESEPDTGAAIPKASASSDQPQLILETPVRQDGTNIREGSFPSQPHQSIPPQAPPTRDQLNPAVFLESEPQDSGHPSDQMKGVVFKPEAGLGKETNSFGREPFNQVEMKPFVAGQTEIASNTSSSTLLSQSLPTVRSTTMKGVLLQEGEKLPAIQVMETTPESGTIKLEAGKEPSESGMRGAGSDPGQGPGVNNGSPGFSQSYSGHSQPGFSSSLQAPGLRGEIDQPHEFPGQLLNRLQMDVQISETQRVQIDVGVQHRQVFAGLVTDQTAIRNLALQFVPQLEDQLTNLDMELSYFSTRAHDEQEHSSERQSGDKSLQVGTGKSSSMIRKPQDTTVPFGAGIPEKGMHLVA